MKSQGYNDRLDEHLAMRRKGRAGKMRQSMASRRHESEGMERHAVRRKYSADREMDRGHRGR